eukprot:6093808-Pleurochrysis_carterae.AAC.1
MAGEVKEAERVAQEEQRQRAAIEKRLNKALTEQNEMAAKLAESLRTARDGNVVPMKQHEKEMSKKDAAVCSRATGECACGMQ